MKLPYFNPAKPWPKVGLPTRYDSRPFPSGPESAGWLAAGSRAARIVTNGGIVLINGSWGTGKTYIACELSKAAQRVPEPYFRECGLSDHRRPVVYYIAKDLFDEFQAAFGGGKAAQRITEDLADASILIIDELSKSITTENERQRLNTIINLRYSRNRPTILIGNYDRDAIKTAVDPSILDRIRECGGVILCDWPSFRGMSAKVEAPPRKTPTKQENV